MEFLEGLKDNWWFTLIALPVILGLIGKFVKNQKLCEKANKLDWIGQLIEMFLLRFFPAKSYEDFIEGMIVSLLDAGAVALNSIKRGILKNNIKAMAKKKMEATLEYKALQEAMETLKK